MIRQKSNAKRIEVSVVILTKNGADFLEQSLQRIFDQKTTYSYEIICVDSGSTDSTLKLLKKYPVKLFTIPEDAFNHGLTRNLAVSQSCGQYIILLSQDAVPCNEYWMGTLVKTLERDQNIAGAYCRQIAPEGTDPFIKRRTRKSYPQLDIPQFNFIQDAGNYQRLKPQQKYQLCRFDNVCSCIRKSAWEELPFTRTEFAADLDWAKRVLERGYKTVYQPQTSVIHAHNRSIDYEYRRAYFNYRKLNELFQLRPRIFFVFLFRRLLVSGLGSFYYACKDQGLIKAIRSLKRIYLLCLADVLAQRQAIKDQRLGRPYKFKGI
ncbi:glycosyltransferase family 2 protein [Candidatus Omnitrophota bacterium]